MSNETREKISISVIKYSVLFWMKGNEKKVTTWYIHTVGNITMIKSRRKICFLHSPSLCLLAACVCVCYIPHGKMGKKERSREMMVQSALRSDE